MPALLRGLVLSACHDAPAYGGHVAFKATCDRFRDRYWWTTKSKDVRIHEQNCLSCQHGNTSHRTPRLAVGRWPVTRPFQCVAIDLTEDKSSSEGYKYGLSVIDHLNSFFNVDSYPR